MAPALVEKEGKKEEKQKRSTRGPGEGRPDNAAWGFPAPGTSP